MIRRFLAFVFHMMSIGVFMLACVMVLYEDFNTIMRLFVFSFLASFLSCWFNRDYL